MKKLLFFSVLFLSRVCASFSSSFVNDDLKHLLQVMEVPHDGTLQSMIKETQKTWKRPVGKERWHIENNLSEIQTKAVMEYCSKNQFFTEIVPAKKEYDYAVILGSTVATMKKRIDFLEKVAKSGVQFKQVVLLSGARPLDSQVEIAPEGCQTEGDAIVFLWKACSLSKQIPWAQFHCPMTSVLGVLVRPTTADTYNLWLASKPKAGGCCMVSNQPFCLYQQLVAESLIPKEFTFETVGPAADPDKVNPANLLDTIARCLYTVGQN
ncbi:MAG TPA: hypothetical protein VHK67_01905 [Rhabdochlamydiaceae bacterium]|jgi:hypothetical protein|nr:hypothetical protein [Rhabdochlamydiaceae bacterium]